VCAQRRQREAEEKELESYSTRKHFISFDSAKVSISEKLSINLNLEKFLKMAQNTKSNKNKQPKQQQPGKKGPQEVSKKEKKRQTAETKKSCGCCKWVLGSIFLIALIGGLLAYDTNVNGKGVFAKSATGKVLQNAGLLPHVEKAWYTTMSASARGYKWAEINVPPYAKPVLKLSCDLYKVARNAACNAFGMVRNFVVAKLPVVGEFVEQYVPGLPKKIEDTSVVVKDIVVDAYAKSVTFFKTQVLVGRFSPENLSKALNDTQNIAAEYYILFHKKVDAYAKLK